MVVAGPVPSVRSAGALVVLAILGLLACGDDGVGPSRTQIFSGTLAPPPETPRAAAFAVHELRVGRRGGLEARVDWTGEGALWLDLFTQRPPTSEPALASSPHAPTQVSPVLLSAVVGPGDYYLLVSQALVPAGPNRGACGCVNTYTLTVEHPGP